MYTEGGIKSQSCPHRVHGKKLVLKGSNFKPIQGLDISTVTSLLEQLIKEKLSIAEMAKECKKVKSLRDLQKAFIDEIGVKTRRRLKRNSLHLLVLKPWISISRETLRKPLIAIGNPHRLALLFLLQHLGIHFPLYNAGLSHSARVPYTVWSVLKPSAFLHDGIFQHERSTVYVLPTQTISYSSINSLCSTSRTPFKGFALILINFSDLNTDEGKVHYVCSYIWSYSHYCY
jgi:hypothetical protein